MSKGSNPRPVSVDQKTLHENFARMGMLEAKRTPEGECPHRVSAYRDGHIVCLSCKHVLDT